MMSDRSGGVPVLLGVPFDAASSFLRGAADAPAAIRAALRSPAGNMWSETLHDLGAPDAFEDAGDLVIGTDPRTEIEHGVRDLVLRGLRPIVLGGDHSISYPVLRAVRAAQRPLTVLHFDAHNDLYDDYEGDRFSHACPFARVMEENLADQLIQVGIRAMTGHLRAQADRFGVEVIDMRRWARGDRYVLRHPVYISLDMDAIDPAFAPGVSHQEAGGLSVRDVVSCLHRIDVPIVGADLVEFNPSRDLTGATASACAKLLKELIAAMRWPGEPPD